MATTIPTTTTQPMTQVDPTTGQPLLVPGAGTVPVTNISGSTPIPTVTQGDTQVAAAPQQPTDPSQVDTYLNQYQATLASATPDASPIDNNAVQTGMNEIKNLVTPTTPAPVAPNLQETYGQLRGQYGLDAIDATISSLKAQIRDEQALTQQRINATKNERVRLDVVGGRVSEIEQQQNERLTQLNNSLSAQVDLANSAYNVINQITQFKQMDFQNASQLWTEQFNQNMQLYDAFQSAATREQQTATANLQIYSNLITSGNLQYSSLDSTQKLELNKLEIKSGLGIGFLAGLKMTPGSDIKSITQRTDPVTGIGYADTIYVNPDGSLRVVTTQLGKTSLSAAEALKQKQAEMEALAATQDKIDKKYSTGKYAPKSYSGGGGTSTSKTSATATLNAQVAEMNKRLAGVMGTDGHTNPNDFLAALQYFVKTTGTSVKGFISRFKGYINPNHYWEYVPASEKAYTAGLLGLSNKSSN